MSDNSALVTIVIAWLIVSLVSFLFSSSSCHAAEITMVASYYGSESGSRTASGERFHPNGFSAAHRRLPFGTRLRVCYRGCTTVRVNDRGPAAWTHRSLDLSKGAARVIGLIRAGVARVKVTILGND